VPGPGDLLGRRELNRATLARQLLLGRHDLPAAEAVGRLGGLNAQDPEPPYLALWARLTGFERDALTRALEDRSVVRGSLLRATQHLATAADYLAWRPLLQPVLERGRRSLRAAAGIDLAELSAVARRLLAERPLTRPALGRLLAERWPGRDPVERLGAELRRFRDEAGRVLYDLPDAPRPDPDTPALPRFLPAFDNLLLAHADRTRVMTDEHRRRVSYASVVEPTVLVDGQVAAVWRMTREPGRATLAVEPLTPLSSGDRAGVALEGERLLAFAADDAPDHDLRFLRPEP
jgi:Winged helix DNA-binding domain